MNTQVLSALAFTALLLPTGAPERSAPPAFDGGEAVTAAVATPPRLTVQPESRIWFEGSSTVRGYTCAATELMGEVSTDPNRPTAPIAVLKEAVLGGEITVPVARLDCDNGTMNDHMRKALKADEHATITYRLGSFDLGPTGEAEGQIEMKGRLTIAGQERDVAFPAEVVLEADGAIRVRGQTVIDMTEFGVKPPRLMLGTLKVHDNVTVFFDVVFKG